MANTDSLKIYELENSIKIINEQLLVSEEKVDSLSTTINNIGISQGYFSDILSSQITLFSIIVGAIGLFVGLSIWGYFNWKFKILDEKIETNGKRDLTADKSLKDLMDTKEKNLKENILELKSSLKTSIEDNSNSLQTIIDEYKSDFKNEKDVLLNKIYETDLDTCRSMYFYCEKEKLHSNSFSWLMIILEHIVLNKLNTVTLDTWVDVAIETSGKIEYNEWIKDNYIDVKEKLSTMSKEVEDKKIKISFEKISFTLGKLYYDNYKDEEDTNDGVEDAEIVE